MLNRKSEYVENYLKKVAEASNDILQQDYSELQEYRMPWTYGYVENGEWLFRVVKSQDTGICLKTFISKKFENLVNDQNIMCIGVNRFPPKTFVKEHTDPPYYGKNLWRILVPIKASNAYLKGMYGAQKIEEGKCYIFDLTYEMHHGWNASETDDFIIMTIDITYEDQTEYDPEESRKHLPNNYSRRDLDYYYENNVYKKIANTDLSMYEKVN